MGNQILNYLFFILISSEISSFSQTNKILECSRFEKGFKITLNYKYLFLFSCYIYRVGNYVVLIVVN